MRSNDGVQAKEIESPVPGVERTSQRSISIRTDPFTPGEVLAGKYRIERVIGEGAMGIVLAANHLELDEIVALKFIRPEMQEVPDIVGRFAREAKAASRIKSEHVTRVFDVGMEPGRGPYIVMEYLEGRDLNEVLRQEGPLPIRRAVEYVMQACEALAMAHVNGITHRDIKPENIFLTRQGDVDVIKILDFGISKAALTGPAFGKEMSLVETACFLGTPLYMSPEQIRATSTADHRTDIWSIGTVLYELLTQRTAFSGASITQVCALVLEGSPVPLCDYCPLASKELMAIIDRCLAKEPADRFQNVADLAVALLPFAPSRARLYADRATSVLRGAGVGVDSDFRSSSWPPPDASSTVRIAASARASNRSAEPTVSFKPTAPPSDRRPDVSTAPLTTRTFEPPPPSRRTMSWVAAAVVASFAGLMVQRSTRSPVVSNSAPFAPSPTMEVAPSGTRALFFLTEPSDARIEIDGTLAGRTPLRIALPAGLRVVQVSKEGYEALQMSLQVEVSPAGAEPEIQRVTLRKVGGVSHVDARSNPPGPTRPVAGARPRSPAGAAPQPSAPRSVEPAPLASPSPAATDKRVRLVEDSPRVQLLQ